MNVTTTITQEQANELYNLRRNKAWSWYELANRYGISEAEARRIFDRMNVARINAAQGIETFDVEEVSGEEVTTKAYATMTEIMDELYEMLGADAVNYDVYAIAYEVSDFKDGVLVADLTRDDLPLIIAMHELTEDWNNCVDLPEGIDPDVRTVLEAATYTVLTFPSNRFLGIDSVFGWFEHRGIEDTDYDLIDSWAIHHLAIRSRIVTAEYRDPITPINDEVDLIDAWADAKMICEWKGLDAMDSATMCRVIRRVTENRDWRHTGLYWI